jgi:hypothetical protein
LPSAGRAWSARRRGVERLVVAGDAVEQAAEDGRQRAAHVQAGHRRAGQVLVGAADVRPGGC